MSRSPAVVSVGDGRIKHSFLGQVKNPRKVPVGADWVHEVLRGHVDPSKRSPEYERGLSRFRCRGEFAGTCGGKWGTELSIPPLAPI